MSVQETLFRSLIKSAGIEPEHLALAIGLLRKMDAALNDVDAMKTGSNDVIAYFVSRLDAIESEVKMTAARVEALHRLFADPVPVPESRGAIVTFPVQAGPGRGAA